MKKGIFFAAIVSIVIACGSSGPSEADMAAGKKHYKTYCVACHGLNGKMALNGAKDLTVSILTMAERVTIVTNGKGLMTPFKGLLKPEEIKQVAAYTHSMSTKVK